VSLLQAIILGIVQGATEFLPISSSGHLVLVPWWLNWDIPADLVFTVAVHLGTLVAVLVYFWRDWLRVLQGAWKIVTTRRIDDPDSRLFLFLIVGSIPVGIIGALFASEIEQAFQQPAAAAGFLLVTAALLVFSELRTNSQAANRTLNDMSWLDAILVGVAQLLALFPGVSRSGSTIAAGLFRGITRPDAARFSFLLGTPAIIGAGLITGLDLIQSPEAAGELPLLLAGFISAGIVGYASIAFLLTHLRKRRLYIFAAYCTVVGLLSLLVALAGR
jgi:undecaprenyl-diphosphatase